MLISGQSPQSALKTIQGVVGNRYNWRIMTGGSDTKPKFVVTRRVPFMLARGLNMDTQFTLSGTLTQSKRGSHLSYQVSGQPFMTALLGLTWLFVIPLMIWGLLSFTVTLASVGLSVLLAGAGLGYVWMVIRRYRYHLRQMHELIESLE
jgi:hypothetical protein